MPIITTMQIPVDESFSDELKSLVRNCIVEATGDISTLIAKPYLKREEVCKLLGISKNTLNAWFDEGLNLITVNGIHLISRKDLDMFLNERKVS